MNQIKMVQKSDYQIGALDHKSALRYLGIVGEVPTSTWHDIETAEQKLRPLLQGRAVWRICSINEDEDGIWAGPLLLPGEDIKALLHGAREAVLVAATIGTQVDTLIRRLQVTDRTLSMTVDALASSAVEQVVDDWESQMIEQYAERGRFLSDRFSPGYGDMPLSVQGEFLRTVDATRQIGLGKTAGDLLTPIKSVTAIVGVFDEPVVLQRRACDSCRLQGRCSFRERGGYCGKN